MYPLDVLTNAPRPVTLAGKSYPVRQLKLREWGEVQAWLKSMAPSPIAVAARGILELQAAGMSVPQATEDAIYRQAQAESRTWPPRVASPEWYAALDRLEGGLARLVLAGLRAGGTNVPEDDAAEIALAAAGREVMDLVRVMVHGEHLVPKAAGESPPPSPTTGDGSTNSSAPSTGSPSATSAS